MYYPCRYVACYKHIFIHMTVIELSIFGMILEFKLVCIYTNLNKNNFSNSFFDQIDGRCSLYLANRHLLEEFDQPSVNINCIPMSLT